MKRVEIRIVLHDRIRALEVLLRLQGRLGGDVHVHVSPLSLGEMAAMMDSLTAPGASAEQPAHSGGDGPARSALPHVGPLSPDEQRDDAQGNADQDSNPREAQGDAGGEEDQGEGDVPLLTVDFFIDPPHN